MSERHARFLRFMRKGSSIRREQISMDFAQETLPVL